MKLRKIGVWAVLGAFALTAAIGLAACGGGDDDGGDGGGGGIASSGGTGSDEKYVADLCKATLDFSKAMDKVTADPSKLNNASDISKAFSAPFEDYAKAVAKAKPPKDLKEYHDNVVKALNDASKAIKGGGNLDALGALGDDLPDPPQATQDRLQKIADKNKDCADADFSFD
ncbi:MAG: hypothetical protein C0506_10010 [Anaerolinea sp.]|nr:hypothetical protein [Anaerolinea sp.]